MSGRRTITATVGSAAMVLGGLVAAPPTTAAAALRPTPILFHGEHGVEAIDPDGTNRRVLVADGGQADQTAGGERLVYIRGSQRRDEGGNLRSTSTLHTASGDGTDQRPLGDGTVHGHNPRWSPDGTRIAFDLRPADATFTEPEIIAVVGHDGRGLEVIGAGRSPDWSPDGGHLVFEALNRLWVVPARAGSAAVAITPPTEHLLIVGPQWSPDGTVIAFGGSCLGRVHPDGSGFRCQGERTSGSFHVGGWDPTSRQLATSWGGFHQWTGLQWTDPTTGTTHRVGSLTTPTSWANPAGSVPCAQGYWLLGRDGGVFSFGTAAFHGSTGGRRLNRPVVGMAPTPTGHGYWLVAGDGGIFSFGDATFHGSTGGLTLKAPVVGMAATPTGRGYWLVAGDGGVFTFGDAAFLGSTGSLRLKAPVVGMAPTPSGRGYWLVAGDGGIFSFGDASFHGSTGALELAQPIVAMTATATGAGYTLVGRDGGTFVFGDAAFPGSASFPGLPAPVAAAGATAGGGGVLLATTTGEVVALEAARFCGSARGLALAAPIVGAAAVP